MPNYNLTTFWIKLGLRAINDILSFLEPKQQLCQKHKFPTFEFDKIFRQIFGQNIRISKYIRHEHKTRI